jgi:hypothetical protein
MRHPRTVRFLATLCALSSFVLVGCGDEGEEPSIGGDSGVTNDSATPDTATPDSTTPDSATPDSTTPDTAADSGVTDSGATDSSLPGEGGADSASSDGATDAAPSADGGTADSAAADSLVADTADTAVALVQMDLPVSFDDPGVAYGLAGFGGAEDSSIVADPAGGTNKVAKVNRSATAELWAGTTITAAGGLGFAKKVPFTLTDTRMTVRVYSPAAGVVVRLKVEDHTNAAISVETEATTTVAGAWETLTFEFASQVPGTAALDLAKTYDKASVFFDFGKTGATVGARTYYFDDVRFIGGTTLKQMELPVTFDDPKVAYGLVGFGGAEDATLVTDPTSGTNKVARVNRSATAETWAGTTLTAGPTPGFAKKVPFAPGSTKLSLRVYAPAVGKKVRLKVEDRTAASVSVETDAVTTKAGAWETLTFDFSAVAAGTAALDLTKTYDKASVFFDYGTTGATAGAETFYFDDLQFVPGTLASWATITFDDAALTYSLLGFGGESGLVSVDPTVATNKCAKLTRPATAEVWAGTTISTVPPSAVPTVPLTVGRTTMTARVYSPDSGVTVRLKLEDAADATRSVETEAITTTTGWQTLTFNFATPAAGTAALNYGYTFNKLSVFPAFLASGLPEKIFYVDDIAFP